MPRVVVFDEFGGPDVLHVVDDPASTPGACEVRVRIEAFAVNPLDLMMRSGASPAPVPLPHARLGVEGTGVVDALGADVTGLAIGDPIILAAIPDAHVRGSYAEYTTVPASHIIARPVGLGIEEAAAIWVAFSTAYGALVEKAGLRPGDHVLATAASGAVGRAAMQIVNRIGAVPIAVTRSSAREAELHAAGAAAVIATDRADIVESVRHHTGGAGVDVVLDMVMGPGQQELAQVVRPGGSLIAAGFLDPRPAVQSDFELYRSFEHTLDAEVVTRMFGFLDAGLRGGALRPAVDRVFALDEVAAAHRYVERGLHGGRKIVIVL